MNQEQARRLVDDTLGRDFNREKFIGFANQLLQGDLDASESFRPLPTDVQGDFRYKHHERIEFYEKIGSYADALDVLIIKLRRNVTLQRGRVTLREFAADYLIKGQGLGKSGVLAAFYSEAETTWRFSYVKVDATLERDAGGAVKEAYQKSEAKRFSFLVGKNERTHTARKQFLPILTAANAQKAFEMPISANRWQGKDAELELTLRNLFSYGGAENPFNETETEILIKAIESCKILDPACGSGAFPIGVLQRLVFLLGKLDAENKKWKQWLKQRAVAETAKTFESGDVRQRETRLLQINEAFEKDSSDYGRKLFLIENCIYGVDIQAIAAEISKLRCFLTLVVDDTIDDQKPNRGVNPLPNLEFKFVTADALLKLPERGLFNSDVRLAELEAIRHEYINSYGATKEAAKQHFKKIQDEIFHEQIKNNRQNPDKRALALSTWQPFAHEKVDWFDSLWMFGVKAFDIVIGNPPYGAKLSPDQIERYKKGFQLKTTETAILFIEKGHELLKKQGIENYIVPKSFSFASNYGSTRDFVSDELSTLGDCGKAFDNVKLEACVILVSKGNKQNSYTSVKYGSDKMFRTISHIDKNIKKLFGFFPNGITTKEIQTALKMSENKLMLNDISTNKRGEILNQFVDNGKFSVIGGKEIGRHGLKNIRGKINQDLSSSNAQIKSNSVLVQGIVAHILYPQEHIKIIACLGDNIDAFIADNLNQIVVDNNLSNKAVWSLLNSTAINWFAYLFIYGKSIRTMRFDNPVTSRIPIPSEIFSKQQIFINLVDYILFLKERPEAEQVNEYVPNSRLVEEFEEVIDALVYELYFAEDFERANIAFLRYATRDFPPLEDLTTREQKARTINEAYQRLRQKDSEIQINLKLMDIRLSDLIMPIKTAR